MDEKDRKKGFLTEFQSFLNKLPPFVNPIWFSLMEKIEKLKKEREKLNYEKEILLLEREKLLLEQQLILVYYDKIEDDSNIIMRMIEFSPEHYQAGMSILSYFNKFLTNKYPQKEVKIKIEQDGLIVRMIIETKEGDKEIVEEILNSYGLIVKGEMKPEDFLDNKIHILELKQQLRLAYVQLETQKDLMRISEKQFGQRVISLEEEVMWLRGHVGNLLTHSENTSQAIALTVNDLLEFFGNLNDIIKTEIESLYIKIENGLSKGDEEKIKIIFNKLKRENPGAFLKLILFLRDSVVKGSISGASGHLLYDWIKNILKYKEI